MMLLFYHTSLYFVLIKKRFIAKKTAYISARSLFLYSLGYLDLIVRTNYSSTANFFFAKKPAATNAAPRRVIMKMIPVSIASPVALMIGSSHSAL